MSGEKKAECGTVCDHEWEITRCPHCDCFTVSFGDVRIENVLPGSLYELVVTASVALADRYFLDGGD
jgi:hypothetical protein